MTIPDNVKCPICPEDTIMDLVKTVGLEQIVENHKLNDGKKSFMKTEIYKCPKCDNLQSFFIKHDQDSMKTNSV